MRQSIRAETGERLAVADALDRLILWARRAAPSRMSSTSVTTLDSLAHLGPQRITDLAAQQGVAQPSMTTLVNRLCHEGLSERVPHPFDRRSMLVAITEQGRGALRVRHAERSAALAHAVGDLSAEQQTALGALVAPLNALTDQTPRGESSHA